MGTGMRIGQGILVKNFEFICLRHSANGAQVFQAIQIDSIQYSLFLESATSELGWLLAN